MRKIFYLFTLILLSSTLYSAEKINYDIKDLKYDVLISEDAEIEVNCERYSNNDKLLGKICSNSKSEHPRYAIITYSKLQEYIGDTKSKIESIKGSHFLVGNKFNESIGFYINIETPKKFLLIFEDEPERISFNILNGIEYSTFNVKFYKEDKNKLLEENFTILEYRASTDYSISPIIELDKSIETLGYKVTDTYKIDDDRECIENYIHYKKHNKTLHEKCKSIPLADARLDNNVKHLQEQGYWR